MSHRDALAGTEETMRTRISIIVGIRVPTTGNGVVASSVFY